MRLALKGKLTPTIVAFVIAAGSVAAASGVASASGSSDKGKHLGSTCTKSELNETVKVGKTALTCKQITLYEWQK